MPGLSAVGLYQSEYFKPYRDTEEREASYQMKTRGRPHPSQGDGKVTGNNIVTEDWRLTEFNSPFTVLSADGNRQTSSRLHTLIYS